MAVSYFNREDEKPTIIVFENSLGVNEFRLWRKFSNNVRSLYPDVETEWEFLSKKFGWFLKYKSDNEVLFYVVPDGFCFRINFVFDQATYDAIQAENLPQDILGYIKAAQKTDRGYSFYWPVRNMKDVELVELLTQFQYETKLQEAKRRQKKNKV